MRLILHLASLLARGAALMSSLLAAIAALACLGGAFDNGLDALTHLAPVWLGLGLLGLVLTLAFGHDGERRALIGLSTLAILASGGLMAPELTASLNRPAKPVGGAPLKLVQFNLWAQNDAPEATLDWILAQQADLVLVEEAGGASWPIVKQLRETYPYAVSCDGVRPCDTWIFSRWPMRAKRGFRQDGQPLAGAWATLRHPGGDFTVAATHYVWPLPAGVQQAQSRRLVTNLAAFDKTTLIVAGDFNSTPWSFSLRRQDKALGLERRTRGLATWPTGQFSRLVSAPFPILPIDHVYAGQAWKTVKVERGPVLGSDHRPVVVTLTR
jgi:endonuclease/exonuclease/phosphatase (EEP) superfamily protein YafD